MAVDTMEIAFRKVISMRQLSFILFFFRSFILKYVKYKGLGIVTGESLIKQHTPVIAGLVQHQPMKIARACYLFAIWSAEEGHLKGTTLRVVEALKCEPIPPCLKVREIQLAQSW